MNAEIRINEIFDESVNLKKRVKAECFDQIRRGAEMISSTLSNGGKLLIFGNGGSASDSSHFACEIVGRCVGDSPAQPAIALTADSAFLTAGANDFGFENVFARQIEAFGKENDLAIGISTSGNSPNVLNAFTTAGKMGIATIGLLGADGGKAVGMVDLALIVPSDVTPRIQEMHITIIHIWCQINDEGIFD